MNRSTAERIDAFREKVVRLDKLQAFLIEERPWVAAAAERFQDYFDEQDRLLDLPSSDETMELIYQHNLKSRREFEAGREKWAVYGECVKQYVALPREVLAEWEELSQIVPEGHDLRPQLEEIAKQFISLAELSLMAV
ncbi:MAG: hypothetical protein WAW37_14240 [Syntrophobacteraceae bacterium]